MPNCCHNPANQIDATPKAGRIRSTCRQCGKWLGYRPVGLDEKKGSTKKSKAVT